MPKETPELSVNPREAGTDPAVEWYIIQDTPCKP